MVGIRNTFGCTFIISWNDLAYCYGIGFQLTRRGGDDDGGPQSTKQSLFSEKAVEDVVFSCSVDSTENIVEDKDILLSIDGTGEGLSSG